MQPIHTAFNRLNHCTALAQCPPPPNLTLAEPLLHMLHLSVCKHVLSACICCLKHLDGAEDPIDIEDMQFNRSETQTEATSVQNLQSGKAYILSEFLRSSEQPDGSAQEPFFNEEEQRYRNHADSVECNKILESGASFRMEVIEMEAEKEVLQKKMKKKSKRKKRKRKEREGKQDENSLLSQEHGLLVDINAAEGRERMNREQRPSSISLSSHREDYQDLHIEAMISQKTSAQVGDGAEELLHKETLRQNDSPTSAPFPASFSNSSPLSHTGYLPHSALPLHLSYLQHTSDIQSYLPELPLCTDFPYSVHSSLPQSSQLTPHSDNHPLVILDSTLTTPIPSAWHTASPSSHSPQNTLMGYTLTNSETCSGYVSYTPTNALTNSDTSVSYSMATPTDALTNTDTSSGYVTYSMATPTTGSYSGDDSSRLEAVNNHPSFSTSSVHPERNAPTFQENEEFLLSDPTSQESDKNSLISYSDEESVCIHPCKKRGPSLSNQEEIEKEELETLSSTSGSVFFISTSNNGVGEDEHGMSLTPLLPSKGEPCIRMSEGYFSVTSMPENDENLGFYFPSSGLDDCHETTPHTGCDGKNVTESYLNIDNVKFEYNN